MTESAYAMANGRVLDRPAVYRIKVRGQLVCRWREWLEGFRIDAQADGETTIVGLVTDQSALYGVLLKVHTLGLLLLLVERVEPGVTQGAIHGRQSVAKQGGSDEMCSVEEGTQ
jgi:hypothetical protein